jgi:hypothetical protein
MSYGKRTCRNSFSNLQVIFMKNALGFFPVIQPVWFEPFPFVSIVPIFGVGTHIIDYDYYEAATTIQIGNNNTSINVILGGNNTIQKIIAPSQIRITAGVKLRQPNDARGKILIKASNYCQE